MLYSSLSNEMYHHGIKGQRWGIRRYQNSDGSMTPKGRERQNNSEGKKKMSTRKKVAIAVGVTAAVAAGAYFVHRYRAMNADSIIKKGKEFQHMGRAVEDLSKPFYASHRKSDNIAYSKNNLFGPTWTQKKTLVGNKDLKIAGKKATLDTFKEWVQTSTVGQQKFSTLDTNNRRQLKSEYYKFNKSMSSPDMFDKKVFGDFYSKVKDKGYDAIRDINDQQYSKKKSPILIIGSLSEIMTVKVVDLTNKGG